MYKLKIEVSAFVILLWVLPLAAVGYGDVQDLLDAQKLSKRLKLSPDQKSGIVEPVERLRTLVAGYGKEWTKQSCESVLWEGEQVGVVWEWDDLRRIHEKTFEELDGIIEKIRSGLTEKQQKRLDKLAQDRDELLVEATKQQIPHVHIDASPLFKRQGKEEEAHVPYFFKPLQAGSEKQYGEILPKWTVKTYIQESPVDEINREPGVAESQYYSYRTISFRKSKLVRSPLIVTATLMGTELVEAERRHLQEAHPSDGQEIGAEEQGEEAIQIRVKMRTPYHKQLLDLEKWTIYVEGDEGVAYETSWVVEKGEGPGKPLPLSVPGVMVERTDMFYHPYMPRRTFYAQRPDTLTYRGHEKLVQLFFPAKDFRGTPTLDEDTKSLKIVLQSEVEEHYRLEVTWFFNQKR